jgi:uncharacterized membrane protein
MRRLLLLIAVAALAATACSSSTGSTGDAAPTTTSAVAGVASVCQARAQLAQSLQMLRGAIVTGNETTAKTALDGVTTSVAQLATAVNGLPQSQQQQIQPSLDALTKPTSTAASSLAEAQRVSTRAQRPDPHDRHRRHVPAAPRLRHAEHHLTHSRQALRGSSHQGWAGPDSGCCKQLLALATNAPSWCRHSTTDLDGRKRTMSDKPITVAVATYKSAAGAQQDFDAVWGIKHEGQIDHLAVAVVEKGDDGKLKIDRHDTSAKHLAWGSGIVGGALTVISAPLGIVFLGPLAATSAVWAGAGGLVGHFWNNIPKDQVRKMSDLLESGDHGLVVVAVNPKGAPIDSLLANADSKVVVDNVLDSDDALDQAFENAEA